MEDDITWVEPDDAEGYDWTMSMSARYFLAWREGRMILMLAFLGLEDAVEYIDWLVKER